MKRRKQIGKLIYTPRWDQGDVELGEDYDGLSRDEKLEALAHWIGRLLSIRNEMIPNPKSWHHFINKNKWFGLTDEELSNLESTKHKEGAMWAAAKLKEKNYET